MLSLESHHIVDLYCWVDDVVPKALPNPKGGRPSVLSDGELVTILTWNAVTLHQTTIKDLYKHARMYLNHEFPRLPTYNAFLDHCHRVTPLMFDILQSLLCNHAPIKIMDSTFLPVCTLPRSDKHRVAKDVAQYGRNHQGWQYGFKLHTAITLDGRLSAVALTPANVFDAQVMPTILNRFTKVAVGDSHYGAKVMGRIIWEKYGTIVIAPPHYKQKKKMTAPWQIHLLNQRSKIEAVFDILKEHLQIVTSFPRSVFGYLVHYVRILLGYQILALCAG